jgi:DNA-binding CsgD family transcriptional regulator
MTHFQILGFRIHALARLGRTDEAIATGEQALQHASESGALQAVPAIELALATAELLHGALDSAADRAQGLLRMPHLHTLVLARETLARIALARDRPEEAQRHATELEAIAQRSGSMRHRALAEYINGRAALQNGENDSGRDLLHAALARYAELGLERETVDVLDELALLAADTGEIERCARLAAAGASTRARLSCALPLQTTERLDTAHTQLTANGDSDCWDAAWAQGEQTTLADAIAYARRGRGRRPRSTAGGWPSLTDTERDVALLAASGKTNPQIAEQLFIARSTVKTHLSSVYRKLDVANRTELALATGARSSGEPSAR